MPSADIILENDKSLQNKFKHITGVVVMQLSVHYVGCSRYKSPELCQATSSLLAILAPVGWPHPAIALKSTCPNQCYSLQEVN